MSSKMIDPMIAVSHVLMSKNSSIGSASKSAAGEESADECSGDADEGRDDEAPRIVAREDRLGDRPGQEPEDDERDDSHVVPPLELSRGIPAPSRGETRGPGPPKQSPGHACV